VLIEVLHSALDATPTGGVMELAAERQGDRAVVTVTADADKPMAGKEAPPGDGARAPGRRERKGTARGLGLAIAAATVRRYGGDLTVDAGPGSRRRFTVSLQVCERSGEPSPSSGPS